MSEKVTFSYGSEDAEFYIQHIKRTDPFERTNHYHANYEVYYLLSGERAYFIKDRSYVVAPGDLLFINKYDVHKTSDGPEPGHERVVINFSDQYLGADTIRQSPYLLTAFNQPSHVTRLKLPEQLFVKSLLEKLTRELKEQDTGFELCARQLLIELLLFACRHIQKNEAAPFEHVSPLHKKISDIVQHINRHYAEPLTLTMLSDRFYISPYYLSRAFKDITGFSFIEYLNITRIREAQRLLEETNGKIIEVASSVGFENIAHFGRVFKKITKLAPLEYRKQKL